MQELSRYLFLAGGLPFLLLGAAHAFATPRRTDERRGLSPVDAQLAASMARTRVLLTGRTDVWSAWVGFNLSHSLGAILFGTVVLLVARTPESFAADAAVFAPLAVVVSLVYLVLAAKYWFRTPIAGCACSAGLFSAAWALWLLAGR